MKRYFLFLAICFIFIGCSQDQEVPEVLPEVPEEPEKPEKPCGCCEVEPIEGYSWFHELAWSCETPMVQCLYNIKPMDFCQIPDDILYSLTTEELVEICIQYPDLYSWAFVNSNNIPYCDCSFYINEVISSFNGLSELFKREDCVYELLRRYDEITDNMAAVCGNFYLAVRTLIKDIELLIGAYQTDGDDAVETYREILRHLVDGYNAQLKFPEIFYPSFLWSSSTNFIARMYMIERISPGTLRSKVKLLDWSEVIRNGMEPLWYWDISDLIPCYSYFYPDKYEGLVINELSYELIK